MKVRVMKDILYLCEVSIPTGLTSSWQANSLAQQLGPRPEVATGFLPTKNAVMLTMLPRLDVLQCKSYDQVR